MPTSSKSFGYRTVFSPSFQALRYRETPQDPFNCDGRRRALRSLSTLDGPLSRYYKSFRFSSRSCNPVMRASARFEAQRNEPFVCFTFILFSTYYFNLRAVYRCPSTYRTFNKISAVKGEGMTRAIRVPYHSERVKFDLEQDPQHNIASLTLLVQLFKVNPSLDQTSFEN